MLDFRKLLLSLEYPLPPFGVLPLFSAKTEGELAATLGINFREGELAATLEINIREGSWLTQPSPSITPLIENYSKRKALPLLRREPEQ